MASIFRAIAAAGALLATLQIAGAATPKQTEAELNSIRQRIERVTRELGRDAAERDRLSRSLREAELSVGDVRGELGKLTSEQAERSARRESLAREREQQQQGLRAERSSLASQLRVAYMIGHTEPLKLLLNQRDPERVSRLLAYYGYFGRARASQIAGIQQRIERLDAIDAELAAGEARLAEIRRERQAQLDKLEARRDQRRQVLASLQRESQSRTQMLARLRNQQSELEKLLRELNRSLKATPPPDVATAFGKLRGRLDWPVSGRLVAEFGDQRAAGVRWEGIVVATERAAAVRAVSAGRVVYADWLPGLGLLAIIDHGEGYLSLYGYNDELRKPVGDMVSAGEVIAMAGDTGGRSRPELYFEIRRAGKPVDPQPWFRRRSPG
jgi:septal ring factor EnvC (AmiA/AmiB activator)